MSSSGSFEKPTSFQSSHQSLHEMIPSSQKKASTAHAQKTEVTGPQSVGSADKFTLDRPYTEKPTPAKGTPSKLQQHEQKEISSNRPHSETQMPQKGVPSKLLQHEKKETPSTKPSTTNTTQYQSQQEPGNSGAPFFNSSETPNKVSGSEMDFHKISSQQKQVNQKTDIPGRPPQNQTSQQQTSLESDTENFQDNSSSKPWSPNQETSAMRPHSEIQMPQRGVPSKLLQHEKKDTPSTKPSTANTTQNQFHQEPGKSGAPFFNSTEIFKKGSGSDIDSHKTSSQQKQLNQKTDIRGGQLRNQTSQIASLESETEKFQDNSSSKPWAPNQETSSSRPHSEIQMPQKGVPSKLLQHEKKEAPSTKPSSTNTTQNQSQKEPGKSGAPFFSSSETPKKVSGLEMDSHKISSQQKH